jgi:hypothetical protein
MKSVWSFLPVSIAAVYVLVILLSRLRAYRKQRRSVEWPMIRGTFNSGSIDPIRGGEIGEGTKFRLKVRFSYGVEDSTYSGEYARDFLSQDEAISLQRSLQQGPLYVRYDPASPADYVLDPYRDVWQTPGSGSTNSPEIEESGSADIQSTVNWWTSPVSLGKLLIFQVAAAIFLIWNSGRNINISLFWFMAGAYIVSAITTKGCCWWAPGGKTLPTWIGRLALVVAACGWIIAGSRFSN